MVHLNDHNGIWELDEGIFHATLRREVMSQQHPNGIAVFVGRYKLGYLPAWMVAEYTQILERSGQRFVERVEHMSVV